MSKMLLGSHRESETAHRTTDVSTNFETSGGSNYDHSKVELLFFSTLKSSLSDQEKR